MNSKLVSLLKYSLIFLLCFAGSARAEYYVVYSEADTAASCYVHHHYVHHSYPRYHHRYHRYHHYYHARRASPDIRVYYVWRVFPAPNCEVQGGCMQSSCNSCAQPPVSPCGGSACQQRIPCEGYACTTRGRFVDTNPYSYNYDTRTADDDWN